jgi:hypothetical protein
MLAIPNPSTPTQVNFSPKNSQASRLIWISMVLLMMLDSIAVSTCSYSTAKMPGSVHHCQPGENNPGSDAQRWQTLKNDPAPQH